MSSVPPASNSPPIGPFNSVWTFDADTQARTYKLSIEYHSGLPAQEHDALHAWLHDQALQWMIGHGIDPAECMVTIKRDCQQPALMEAAAEDLARGVVPVPAVVPVQSGASR